MLRLISLLPSCVFILPKQDVRPRITRIFSYPVGLLRKEVIQPHLPIRLPCYDFTPITDLTFDG